MACELVGLLGLADALSFDKLNEILRACRQALVDVIQGEDGYVAQYRSSGLLAYFGFPQPRDDAPYHAIQAGMDLVKVVRYYNDRLREEIRRAAGSGSAQQNGSQRADQGLAIRIGIHTGPVVESAGDTWFGALNVMGEPLLRAERLQAVAPTNSVVINCVTHALVEDVFDCIRLGVQALEGVDKPMTLYTVAGVKPARLQRMDLRPEPAATAV